MRLSGAKNKASRVGRTRRSAGDSIAAPVLARTVDVKCAKISLSRMEAIRQPAKSVGEVSGDRVTMYSQWNGGEASTVNAP